MGDVVDVLRKGQASLKLGEMLHVPTSLPSKP